MFTEEYMDYVEILTLYEMIKEYNLEEKVAKELKIKKASLKRQMNRIKAYYYGKPSQKRSGKKVMQRYSEVMRQVLETKLSQPIITRQIETPRRLQFNTLQDLLNYRQPIQHISSIRKEGEMWELYIALSSSL